jgi:predicted SnoaL-like aldol condensation-catalyzing enzyme
MTRTPRETVIGFFEQILNARRFELIDEYFNANTVSHNPPYVGCGLITTEFGGKVLVRLVAPGGPAEGFVLPGDEVLEAADAQRTWTGFEALKAGLWGQGIIGTKVVLQLRRGEELLEATIERGLVAGFDQHFGAIRDAFIHYLEDEARDLNVTIQHVIEQGDLVAVYVINRATSTEYNRQAVWAECDLFRVAGGKIVESWGVEDGQSWMRQQGFRFLPPEI